MVSASLQREVRQRAGGLCEYCRLPERLHSLRFHVEHIVSRQNRGLTEPGNLALACNLCNSHKGPNVGGIDSVSGLLVPLFNPRRDTWEEHFVPRGPMIEGLTAIGRVTVHILAMNDPRRVEAREILIAAGLIEG